MDELTKILSQYAKRFNECFPTALFHGPTEILVEAVQKCLDEGKPYDCGFLYPNCDY